MPKRTLLLSFCLLACDASDAADAATEITERCGFVGEVGLIGLDSVDISGNPSVFGPHASVFSNKTVSLAGSFDVEGHAISGGTVSVSGAGSVGGIIEHAARISVYDPSAEVSAAASSNDNARIPCVKKGNRCISPLSGTSLSLSSQSKMTLSSGKYYFTSLSVSGQAKIDVAGAVVIYLAGPATFNGGSATNVATDSLFLVSSAAAEIKLNGSSTARTAIHAPFATVRFAGTNGFRGSVVAKDLRISGTADLEPVGDLTTVYGAACGDAGGADAGGADGGGADGGGADGGGADGGGADGGGADGGGADDGGADDGGADDGGADDGGADDGGHPGGNGPFNRDQPPDMPDTSSPE